MNKEQQQKIITFKVYKAIKGSLDKIITIKTQLRSAACGVSVKKGDQWLLFIHNFNGSKNIDSCSKHIRYNRRQNQDKMSFIKTREKLNRYIKKLKSYKNGE